MCVCVCIMKYVRSFCVAIDAGDIKMFFSLMLIFMCCVNTDERLFLFTRKKKPKRGFFLQCARCACFKYNRDCETSVFDIIYLGKNAPAGM